MNCPKCGTYIKRFDLSPSCKSCGVNLMYYTQQRDLMHDAKMAELEYAGARIFLAKLKAAFISGKAQILRMVLTLVCVGVLAVPFETLTISLPLFEQKLSVGAVGAYELYSSGIFSVLPSLVRVEAFSPAATLLLVLMGIFALLVLAALAVLLIELLSFLNIKKSAKAMSACSIAAIVLCIAAAVTGFFVRNAAAPVSYLDAKAGFGAYAAALAFAAMLAVNIKIARSDIPLKLRENDLLRRETLKKIKRGEINVDDLPLPVFETPQEKSERLQALHDALENEETGGALNE